MVNRHRSSSWRGAAVVAVLAIGLAGLGAGPAEAAGPQPLHHIGWDGEVPLIGTPYVGAELRMGAPGAFARCDRTEGAPDGYVMEWLSNGTPLPPERQQDSLKVLPEDRGNRLSFNVYPTSPEKDGCPKTPEDESQEIQLHSIETSPISASNRAMGWTGRGNFELLGRTDDGELVLYPRTYPFRKNGWCFEGNCPGFEPSSWDEPQVVGTGWYVFNIVFSPGDFDGDGYNDILARDSVGDLYLYPGDGEGGWLERSVVGTGWNIFDSIVGPGDFDGDGINDVLARDRQGNLHLYPGNGEGGWLAPAQVGSGWQIFDKVVAPGDIDGDGGVDIYGRDRGGYLHEYPTDGQGNWKQRSVWGPGWAVMSEISGAGSYEHNLDVAVNGGHPRPGNNVIAINQDGDLLKYGGRFGTQQIGNGWDIFASLI
jgi:hypothetical protein